MPSPGIQQERFAKRIFDGIAERYDLLNRVISFHLDTVWRKKAADRLELAGRTVTVLDLGTGTGDSAMTAARQISAHGRVVGLDIAPQMLRLAEAKKRLKPEGYKIFLVQGSGLAAPFKSNRFEAVLTAFVLRNISELDLFFIEAYRLLKPGGRLAALDMFPPRGGIFAVLYSFYFYRLVPWIGAGLARNRVAYRYLSESVKGFMPPERVAELIGQAGFESVKVERFLKGAVCLHIAEKPVRP